MSLSLASAPTSPLNCANPGRVGTRLVHLFTWTEEDERVSAEFGKNIEVGRENALVINFAIITPAVSIWTGCTMYMEEGMEKEKEKLYTKTLTRI